MISEGQFLVGLLVMLTLGLMFLFIKIDTEGLELEILKNLEIKYKKNVNIICFEANIPLFLKETLMILDMFGNNYFNFRIWDEYKFFYKKNVSARILKSYVKNITKDKTLDIFIFNNWNK